MIILLFIIAKLALYTLWCWYGIRLLAPPRRSETALALAFALACLRLAVGFALGVAWASSISFVAPSVEYSRLGFDPSAFIIGFLVLRLLLWSGLSSLIRIRTGRPSLLGVGVADWLWRLGGVGLSFLGDLAVLAGWISIAGVIC